MRFGRIVRMIFERRTERREKRAHEIEGTPEAEDISVFPMAIPMAALKLLPGWSPSAARARTAT